jgi:hypothetical protein
MRTGGFVALAQSQCETVGNLFPLWRKKKGSGKPQEKLSERGLCDEKKKGRNPRNV